MESQFMIKFKGFWQLANPKIWIASSVPMFVGGAIAYKETHTFSVYWFIVAFIGICAIETGKHGINEWIDYLTGVDKYVEPDKITPFSGGRRTLTTGILNANEVVAISILSMAFAALIGLYVVFFREPLVLGIGLLGFFIAIFYTLPPIKFIYKGLGEIAVGITYGPLVVMGTYVSQAHSLALLPLLASIPIGFLITNILWINQFPDYEADKKGNKRNWVVRIGKEKSVLVYASLYLLAYLSIILVSIFASKPLWLISLLSIPIAVQSVKIARNYYNDIPKLITSNLRTIQVYQLTGLLLIISILVA